ncbi:hypothetical protein HPB50_013229 [Hyalomma asiaticum]|uniref:Uncharacterized protein n=1 Tax=Hyalomma asiaticum TaxID=266040 RepID=A0ACB7THW2_HYAAI|nr:hypothetical protein HPB50_013229 [Hyalomma asiaticum]
MYARLKRFDFAAGGTAPSEWSQAGEMGRWSSYLFVSSAHLEGIDGVNPNARAHTLARECTNRAGGGEASGGNVDLRKDPSTTFNEITSSYKLSRRRFPLPNARLNRAQGITFRLLRTDTYLCPRT